MPGHTASKIDCSPYGSAYLSPPPDSSWRRTNSDSALHTSTMTPTSQQHNAGEVPPGSRQHEMTEHSLQVNSGQMWDPKKQQQQLIQGRPKSCEVPGINIYPSPEQDPTVHSIPISNNTGSLPDLTNLQFPSPMATPLDTDDQYSATQASTLDPASVSRLALEARLHQQYHPYQTQLPEHMRQHIAMAAAASGAHDPMHLSTSPGRDRPSPLVNNRQHLTIVTTSTEPTGGGGHHLQVNVNNSQGASMTQYRNGQSDCPQSPTSPLSQTSYSPSQSPGLSPANTMNSSNFTDAYYVQQQTNALQHRFEHFNMLHENPVTSNGSVNIYALQQQQQQQQQQPGGQMGNMQFTPSDMGEYTHIAGSGQDFVQLSCGPDYRQQLVGSPVDYSNPNTQNCYYSQQQVSPQQQPPSSPQHHHGNPRSPQSTQSPISPSPTQLSHDHPFQSMSPHHRQNKNKIPDIIFTGADDTLSRHDFVKDIGNAMVGMPESFDSDLFPSDEVLKDGLDPLDFDGLQMLTDPNLVTDSATEDTFRLDRL
ncbi:CREB-regulated transcription coactivator 3 [Lamellibrachia satsuma]|nr:CREB-regulated transcription coactivator 3 [Lamellibrachia satsuma]